METPKIHVILAAVFFAFLLTGCASEPVVPEPVSTVDDGPPPAKPVPIVPKAIPPAVNNEGNLVISTVDDMGNVTEEVLQGIFYFDFDQAIVKRAGHEELNKHARVMMSDSMFSARLEGHADERGTREYNLALGERRANAIRSYLVSMGVSSSQMEVISYGEEKPVSSSHDESGWSQNRRVEIIYR